MAQDPKLDQIPDSLVQHMANEMEKGTKDGSSPLELILKDKPFKRAGRSKKPEILDLEGFHIYNEPMALMFFRLVQLKNETIDKILTEANFQMADISGKPIFPRTNDTPTKS